MKRASARIASILLTTVITATSATGVSAQSSCNPRDVAYQKLDELHGERRWGQGVNGRGTLVELWVNPETGSWSVLWSKPDGPVCIVDVGTGWTSRDQSSSGAPGQGEQGPGAVDPDRM